MSDFGASLFSSGAGATAGESLAGESFASTAGEAAATGAEEAAATGAGEAAGTTAAADPFAVGAGPGTESLAGGTFESGAGLTGVEGGVTGPAVDPSLLDQLTSAYNTATPYVNTAQRIMNAANLLRGSQSGAGTPGGPQAQGAPSTAPLAGDNPTAPKMSQEDYERQQKAYWAQLLQGTGQMQGGDLPPNIQDMIRRNASIYAA